jgi:hypothetical protein
MILDYIMIFLWGIALGVNFMAWWKDRNNGKTFNGKVQWIGKHPDLPKMPVFKKHEKPTIQFKDVK